MMNSEVASAQVALAVYNDRLRTVLHTAIELWASASAGVETR